ncbi:MAG: DUF551 domain-containing protein [Leptothrix sp. (in: b-proteobacteria)]
MTTWKETAVEMPQPNVAVLALQKCINRRVIVRAQWVEAKTIVASFDDYAGEYDKETDEYYCPEGWYECMTNHDDPSYAYISSPITHWMPLPAKPEVQP